MPRRSTPRTNPAIDPPITERAVLAVLCEGPAHGFALAAELSAESEIGRVFTVRRPLVYRALNNLVELGLARPDHEAPSTAGPKRIVHVATAAGRRLNDQWLTEPVVHVRDLRTWLLLKLLLLERSGRPIAQLILAQRTELDETLRQLIDRRDSGDVVDRWRATSAQAALDFLNDLNPT